MTKRIIAYEAHKYLWKIAKYKEYIADLKKRQPKFLHIQKSQQINRFGSRLDTIKTGR